MAAAGGGTAARVSAVGGVTGAYASDVGVGTSTCFSVEGASVGKGTTGT